MEILGLNVGNYLRRSCSATTWWASMPRRTSASAAASRAPRLFVFDTENAVINITGNTNLATERLDLSIDPESKGMRADPALAAVCERHLQAPRRRGESRAADRARAAAVALGRC